MADDQNEKPQVVRSPEPGVEATRGAEERRRVAEIVREIEALGRALEGRDRLARFDTAERAESSPAQAGQSAGGVGDRSTPEPEPLPTVADMSIPAIPQQRKLVAEGGPPSRRRKWGPSLAAVIIVLSLVSGGALMLMGPPIEIAQDAYRRAGAEMQRLTAQGIEIAQDAYRSAVAEMQRLTAQENAETEAAGRKAAEEKLAAVAAARRHEEEARQAAEEKARAEAAREMAEAQARAAAQEAAKRQAAEDARLKAEEAARKAAEGKPKSDAEVREQAESAEADLNLSEQDRKKVQVSLTALGHEIPTATGHFGPRTRAMITAWQKKQGLPETGFLDESQLVALHEQATLAKRADQTKPAARQQAERAEAGLATARTAGSEAAQAKEAAERSAATARQALQEERARADSLARDLASARREIEAQVAASGKSGDEATRLQQAAERAAAELRQALQQEHDKAEQLARELATARRELETQAAALTKADDKTAQNQQLTDLRQAQRQAEASAAAYQESLAQERARNRDKPVMPAGDKPAPMAARPTEPEAPGNAELARLMARARLLLGQGNIGAARNVLERAANTGNASALFALAETYDPVVLSAWGTVGAQGDVAKAQELYAKALAGGVLEAKDLPKAP
jgi:peptidoglycan hydrolase-like protein with peptidoglycan-binding domain